MDKMSPDFILRARNTTDSVQACEAWYPGSIPGERTIFPRKKED